MFSGRGIRRWRWRRQHRWLQQSATVFGCTFFHRDASFGNLVCKVDKAGGASWAVQQPPARLSRVAHARVRGRFAALVHHLQPVAAERQAEARRRAAQSRGESETVLRRATELTHHKLKATPPVAKAVEQLYTHEDRRVRRR